MHPLGHSLGFTFHQPSFLCLFSTETSGKIGKPDCHRRQWLCPMGSTPFVYQAGSSPMAGVAGEHKGLQHKVDQFLKGFDC